MESSTDRELSVPVRRRSLAKEEPPTEGFSSAMCFLIVCGLTAILVCYFSQPVAHVPAHPELPSPKSSAYRKNMTPPPKANESITLSQSQSKSISAAPPMATATDDDSDSDNQNAAAHPLSTSGSQEPTPKHSSKKKPSASSSVPPSHTLCLAVRDKLPSLQWDNTDILPPPPTWQISVPAGSDDRVAVPTNCIAQDTLMKDHACWNLLDAKDPNLLDMWLLFNVFRLPWLQTRGHFVEYGAKDGVFGSLSYFFETRLNWTGVCAEPSPTTCERLAQNRPHCTSMCPHGAEATTNASSSTRGSRTKDALISDVVSSLDTRFPLSLLIVRCPTCAAESLARLLAPNLEADVVVWTGGTNVTSAEVHRRVSGFMRIKSMAEVQGVVGGRIFLSPRILSPA
eukprot:c10672_g1_i3.p1 GENE.c10672_g1_i3~~c10672_g1_i3.p1  ORF type:complete len:398 (-),score=71.77 c10672_g1_i3:252-1445(-)